MYRIQVQGGGRLTIHYASHAAMSRCTFGRTEKTMFERGMIIPATFLLLQCNVTKP